MIFLDLDICIHFPNGKDPDLIKRFQAHSPADAQTGWYVLARSRKPLTRYFDLLGLPSKSKLQQ